MVVVQVPPTASPGDTVQYNINGQLMNVVIPDGLLGRAEPRNKNAPPLHEAVRGQVRLEERARAPATRRSARAGSRSSSASV